MNSFVAKIDPSGTDLSLLALDGSGNRTTINSYTPVWSQVINITGASGSWTGTFNGQTTAPIPRGAGTADVQAAFQALSSIGSGNVITSMSNNFLMTFSGSLAGTSQTLITINTSGLSNTLAASPATAGTTLEIDQDALVGPNFAIFGSGWAGPSIAPDGHAYTCIATGTGLNSAVYTFPGLATGNYQLSFAFSGTTGLSPSAKYVLFDGSTYRGTVSFDQSSAQPFFTMASGAAAQPFNTVYVGNGTLYVVLTDAVESGDIGTTLYAGAISILPVNFTVSDYTSPWLVSDFHGVGNGVPKYVNSGTWHSYNNIGNFNGLQTYTLATDPIGTLTWEIDGIPRNATVNVQTNWNVDVTSRTQHASYKVYDGTTLLGTVVVNQEVVISGGLAVTDNAGRSFIFKSLGQFVITTGVLRVVLTSQTDGTTNGGAILASLVSTGSYMEAVSSNVSSFSSGPPSIIVPRLNGGSPITLGTPVQGNSDGSIPSNLLPYMIYPLPSPITESSPLLTSDSVTITVSNNTIFSSAGSIPGATNQAVVNKVGGIACTVLPPSSRTMKIGMNITMGGGSMNYYANYFKHYATIFHAGSVPQIPFTRDGYPQITRYDLGYFTDLSTGGGNPLDTKGGSFYPTSGTSTLFWDGGVIGELLVSGDSQNVVAIQSMDTGHSIRNKLTFSLTLNGSSVYSPNPGIVFMCGQITAWSGDTGRLTYTGIWTTQSGGYNGSYHRNDQLSSSKATFRFGNLPASTYNIIVSHVPNGSNTATATWIVRENGTQRAILVVNQQAGSPQTVATNITFSGGNITVEVTGGTDGFTVADSVLIRMTGTLLSPVTPITNAILYDPTIDASNPPLFHPDTLTQLTGYAGIRLLSALGANSSSTIDFADYATGTEFSFASHQGKAITWQITEIQNWNDPDGFCAAAWPGTNRIAFLITVDDSVLLQSAKLVSGQTIAISVPLGIKLTSGETFSPGYINFTSIEHNAAHMTPNQFAFGGNLDDIDTVADNLPIPPATSLGTVQINYNGIPPVHSYKLVNIIDNLNVSQGYPRCDPWLNFGQILSPACITALATLGVTGPDAINTGLKFYLEKGDEFWNNAPGFTFNDYAAGYSHVNSIIGGTSAGYAKLSNDDFNLFETVLAANGRGSDIVRIIGIQFTVASTGISALAWLAANGGTCDAVAIAPYLGNRPFGEPPLTSIYNGLRVGQTIDFQEEAIENANLFESFLAACNSLISGSGFPTAKLICYEFAQNNMALGGSNTNQALQSQAGHFHPRNYDVMNGYLSKLQNGNVSFGCYYNADQPVTNEGGPAYIENYGIFLSHNMKVGKGDGSDGLYNQLPSLLGSPIGLPDLSQAVSVVGKAIVDWNRDTTSPSRILSRRQLSRRLGSRSVLA